MLPWRPTEALRRTKCPQVRCTSPAFCYEKARGAGIKMLCSEKELSNNQKGGTPWLGQGLGRLGTCSHLSRGVEKVCLCFAIPEGCPSSLTHHLGPCKNFPGQGEADDNPQSPLPPAPAHLAAPGRLNAAALRISCEAGLVSCCFGILLYI